MDRKDEIEIGDLAESVLERFNGDKVEAVKWLKNAADYLEYWDNIHKVER